MPNFDRKNYIVAMLALTVSIASLLLAYFSIRASWQIADASGSFDKANLAVGVGGHALQPGKANYIVIGAEEVARQGVPVVGAIPFTFQSSGKRSLESVAISFQYHDIFNRQLLEQATSKRSGAFSTTEIRKSTSEEARRFFVSYEITTLNPGVSLRIAEPLFLTETSIQDSVPVTSKDGVPITMGFRATYTKNFGLAVSARDTPVIGYSIAVSVQRANSLQDLLSGQLPAHIKERQRRVRTELSALAYFAALLTSSPTEIAYLVYVPLKGVPAGDAALFSTFGGQEAAVAEYSILSWHQLLANGK